MSIKRWHVPLPDSGVMAYAAPDGIWVKHDDVVALEAEVERPTSRVAWFEAAGGVAMATRIHHLLGKNARLTADLASMTVARDVPSKAADDTLAHLKAEAEKHERIMATVTELHEAYQQTRAERDGLAKALRELAQYADDSISSQYGTLRASLVRDIAHEALAALPTKEADDA